MSVPTVQALAASIYDRLTELDITRDLDNEQIWQAAHAAAQTIEDAGTRIPAQRQVGWMGPYGIIPGGMDNDAPEEARVRRGWKPVWMDLP